MSNELPESVQDVLDDNATFEPAAVAAVRKFARSKPFQGTDAERLAKFNTCAAELSAAYGLEPWTVVMGFRSELDHEHHRLVLKKLSVVTFLHAMGAARGLPVFGRFRFSLNLFKRFFPRS